MSLSALVPERSEDVERLVTAPDAFVCAPPDPGWMPLSGERPRAIGRLLAFVAEAGIGAGIGAWLAFELIWAALRS